MSALKYGFVGAGFVANFHLQALSPAIDTGSSANVPATDFDGNVRPFDGNHDGTANFDIGAYEYGMLARVYLPLALMSRPEARDVREIAAADLFQIELPRHAEAVVHPGESSAKSVVIQGH